MLPAIFIAVGSMTCLGRVIYKKKIATGKEKKQLINVGKQVKKPLPTDPTSEEMQEINHYFPISVSAVGLAATGSLFFPFLSLISIPVSLYVSWPIFKTAYLGLIQQRKLKSEMIDTFAILVSLVAGYYFITALSCCIYFIAEKILGRTRDHASKALVNIFAEQPRYIWILKDGVEIEFPFNKLSAGDIIVISAGETIPVDGIVTTGAAMVDQHMLTGESQPYEKMINDQVFTATVVLAGKIHIKALKTGSETLAAQIGEILNNTSKFELAMQTRCEKLADRSVLPTLLVATSALAFLGRNSAAAVVCANYSEVNRVVTPLAMLNFLRNAYNNNILIKDGRVLEVLNDIDTVVFDKTGTLTLNQFTLSGIYPLDGLKEDELLQYAAAAEYRQTHPIAQSIIKAAEKRHLELAIPDENNYEVGYGIKVQLKGHAVMVGSLRFMTTEKITIPSQIEKLQARCHDNGCSSIYVAIDNKLAGMLELSPKLRPEAKEIIKRLKQRKLSLCIISGDQENPTKQLAKTLGIDQYFSSVLPNEKSDIIKRLQQEGKKICFIGDGINDSIALKKANVSISLSGASAVATDTAQVILLDKTIRQLDTLFELSSAFKANQKVNIAAVFVPGVICIGGVFFIHLGIFGSMVLYNISIATGVINALRSSK